MSVRKFLLPVNSVTSAGPALETGFLLARMWNAHLEVMHVLSGALEIAPFASEGLSGALIEDMITLTEREGAARVLALNDMFSRAAAAAAVPVGGGAWWHQRTKCAVRHAHRSGGAACRLRGAAGGLNHRASSAGGRGRGGS